jgi:hypothetical protein
LNCIALLLLRLFMVYTNLGSPYQLNETWS